MHEQPDMFAAPPRYPHAAGYTKGSATSRQAAEAVNKTLSERQQAVYDALAWRGPMTFHEIAAALELPVASVQPRLAELSRLGMVADSGSRRPSPYPRRDGRTIECTVWEAC